MLFNNVFWDNRAGSLGTAVLRHRHHVAGRPATDNVNHWDMGVADGPAAQLSPTKLG